MVSTGQSGRWYTIIGTMSEVRSQLDTDGIDREDVLGIVTTGSDFKILAWKGTD